MKALFIICAITLSLSVRAATIKGQVALDLRHVLQSTHSVDMIATKIQCIKKTYSGMRVLSYSCSLQVRADKDRRFIIGKELSKRLWPLLPGTAKRVGWNSINNASVLDCRTHEACRTLDCRAALITCRIEE